MKSFRFDRIIRPFLLSFILLILIGVMPQNAWADSTQDLAGIARTREIAIEAINSRDFSKIEPLLHPDFTITTVDHRIFHDPQEFERYWNQQFTDPIENIAIELTGDIDRTFLSNDTEVAYGAANSTFYFTDGNVRVMPLRWTAVLKKLQTDWTIQTLHFSSNLLDNPVLKASQKQGQLVAIASGVSGFLIGAGTIWLLRRQPKSTDQSIEPS